jgi:hypothetical protein
MRGFVLTIDQQASRREGGRAPEWAQELNDRHGDRLTLPFAVTAGDELQGLLTDPEAFVAAVRDSLRPADAWWIGAGVGEVQEPLPQRVNEATGDAFVAARDAVEAAKKSSEGIAVRGAGVNVRGLNGALSALAHIARGRSEREWETVDLAEAGLTQREIAERLGVTQQAVSKRLAAGGWPAEQGARDAAVELAARALESAS